MQQPVQDGRGHDRVAEHVTPVTERLIRGQQDAAAFVTCGNDLEQQMGGARRHRQVAELVDDEQLRLDQTLKTRVPWLGPMGPHQGGHEHRGGDEADTAILLYGSPAETDGQMGLADPGRTRHQHVLTVSHPAGGAEVPELIRIDARLGLEVEVVEFPHHREAGLLQA